MDVEQEKPGAGDPGIDALLESLGVEGADELLAQILNADDAPGTPVATSPKEIRQRVKELAARKPELIIKIINHWIKEDRGRR